MPLKVYTTEEIIAYLLDQMPESEADNFEQSYFEDQALASSVTEVEDNLVDDYVRGQLKWRQKKLFEKNYLSIPSRRRRVETARLFISKVDPVKKHTLFTGLPALGAAKNNWLQSLKLSPAAVSALAGLLVIGVGFYLWQLNYKRHNADSSPTLSSSSSQSPTPQSQISPAPLQTKEVREEVAKVQPPQSASPRQSQRLLTLTLDANEPLRGPGGPKSSSGPYVITDTTKEIQLRLRTKITNYQAYTAKVLTGDDKEVFVFPDKITPVRRGHLEIIILTIPASSFKGGSFSYTLALSGILDSDIEPAQSITFQIDKR